MNTKSPTHPSWAIISLTHTSGSMRMFRSPGEHHAFMTIRIHHASLNTRMGGDREPWPEAQIVEVRLTPIQFAEMITQPNRANGVACTLTYLGRERMPEPPKENDEIHDFAEAAGKNAIYDSVAELENLIAYIDKQIAAGKGLSLTAAREFAKDLRLAHSRATVDLDYWRKELAERGRNIRSKVTTDLHATADLIVRNMGLEALKEKARAMLPTFVGERVITVDEDGQ